MHFHVAVADGVFTRADDTGVTFHEERAPSREEVAGIVARVAKRMLGSVRLASSGASGASSAWRFSAFTAKATGRSPGFSRP